MQEELIATLKELTESVDCLRGSVEELNKHLIDIQIAQLHKELNKCCCDLKERGNNYDS